MAKSEKPAVTTKASGKAKKAAAPKPTGNTTVETVKAAAGKAKGKVDKAVGKATGDKKLQAKGQAEESGSTGYGKAQKARKKLK